MSYIECDCGRRHWGPDGAAGLALTDPAASRILLQLRSGQVLNPHTWALPGGALERGESATEAALREAQEEVGLDVASVRPTGTLTGLVHPQWSFTYVLASTGSTELSP